MRVAPVIGALALLALAGRTACGQSAERPNLIFSVSGGYTTGGELWRLARLTLAASGGGLDTVALARRLRPGFAAVLSATLFRSPHLGYTLEAGLFALNSEARCSVVGEFKPDAERLNEQACGWVQGRHLPTSAFGFQAGVAWRMNARGAAQPYVRAGAGFALLGNSFVQTVGLVTADRCRPGPGAGECQRLFLDEGERRQMTWMATAAAGAMLMLNPGYNFRFEVRDAVVALPIVTGPASPEDTRRVAATGTKVKHVVVLAFGLDVVLERRRPRRY